MEKILAFSCSHCKKIYATKDSCKSHEYRCYFNPRTRSCASCSYFNYSYFEYAPPFHVAGRTCFKNHDVTKKMKTQCLNHHDKKVEIDTETLKVIKSNYDPKPFIQPILDRARKEHEDSLKAERELNEQGYVLEAEALIGLLGSAVGVIILLKQEVELTPVGQDDDDSLERHFESRQSTVDDVVYLFERFGIEETLTKKLIMDVVASFPEEPLLYMPLCRQGEIQFHEKKCEIARLWSDTDGEAFHRSKVDNLKSKTTTGMIGQFMFPRSGFFSDDTPDLNSYGIFMKILEEKHPELKQVLIEGIKNPVTIDIPDDSPF